jgi:hypothetical protein
MAQHRDHQANPGQAGKVEKEGALGIPTHLSPAQSKPQPPFEPADKTSSPPSDLAQAIRREIDRAIG